MESTAPGHRDLVKFFRKKMKEKKNERKITRFFR
jgi:sulfur relay (sulfurtransferase) DsrC/TusE family protein